MGQCASGEKSGNRKPFSFECQPAGTEALKDMNLPKLLFHANLANVKLKQYPYVTPENIQTSATAYFRVREGQSFALSEKNRGDKGTIMVFY